MDMYPGCAKRIAEMQICAYFEQYSLDNFAIFRPSKVYGPGDNFVPNNAMVIPSLMSHMDAQEDPVSVWVMGLLFVTSPLAGMSEKSDFSPSF